MKGSKAEKILFAVGVSFAVCTLVLWTVCAVLFIKASGNVFKVNEPVLFFSCMAFGGVACILSCVIWYCYFGKREKRKRAERAKRCAACGATLYVKAAFCPRCGKPQKGISE